MSNPTSTSPPDKTVVLKFLFSKSYLDGWAVNGYESMETGSLEEGLQIALSRANQASPARLFGETGKQHTGVNGFKIVEATLGPGLICDKAVKEEIRTIATAYFGHVKTKITKDHGKRKIEQFVCTDAGESFPLQPGDRVYDRRGGLVLAKQ